MKQGAERYIVKPLVGAFRLLELLSRAGRPSATQELASLAGMSKTTAFRYLKTLQTLGYVQEMRSGVYEIGPAVSMLGRNGSEDRALIALARESMQALSRTFGQTVNLAVPNGKRLRYIHMIDTRNPLRFEAEVGDSECFHCTALGKAILAFVPPDEIDGYLSAKLLKFTDRTILTRRMLGQALADVRRLGYAIDREENELGCTCFAAPIFDLDRHSVAAVSVSVPTLQLTALLDVQIAESVKQAAADITALLQDSLRSVPRHAFAASRRGRARAAVMHDLQIDLSDPNSCALQSDTFETSETKTSPSKSAAFSLKTAPREKFIKA